MPLSCRCLKPPDCLIQTVSPATLTGCQPKEVVIDPCTRPFKPRAQLSNLRNKTSSSLMTFISEVSPVERLNTYSAMEDMALDVWRAPRLP
jgi:hypothetical protein